MIIGFDPYIWDILFDDGYLSYWSWIYCLNVKNDSKIKNQIKGYHAATYYLQTKDYDFFENNIDAKLAFYISLITNDPRKKLRDLAKKFKDPDLYRVSDLKTYITQSTLIYRRKGTNRLYGLTIYCK